jgi:hypothetical protein
MVVPSEYFFVEYFWVQEELPFVLQVSPDFSFTLTVPQALYRIWPV